MVNRLSIAPSHYRARAGDGAFEVKTYQVFLYIIVSNSFYNLYSCFNNIASTLRYLILTSVTIY